MKLNVFDLLSQFSVVMIRVENVRFYNIFISRFSALYIIHSYLFSEYYASSYLLLNPHVTFGCLGLQKSMFQKH